LQKRFIDLRNVVVNQIEEIERKLPTGNDCGPLAEDETTIIQ